MVLNKLLKKDNTGLYEFIKQVKDLKLFIDKINKKNLATKENVITIIRNVKALNISGKELKKKILELIKDNPKKYVFHLKLLTEKMDYLEELNKKVCDYEKKLNKYDKLKNGEN